MPASTLHTLLTSCASPTPHFPPTILYNEGWLLRLVLDWFSQHRLAPHPLAFPAGADWFSEALLPSPFLPRFRGDPLSESRTHADGVIGHIQVGMQGKADLELQPGATHFVVCEAKLFSSLSANVKNVPDYDQAARNVACMGEVLSRAKIDPLQVYALGFYVLAPQSQIEAGVFAAALDRASIQKKIEDRVRGYQGERDAWFCDWFLPVFPRIAVEAISWEEVIAAISAEDPASGRELMDFYERCLDYNRPGRK